MEGLYRVRGNVRIGKEVPERLEDVANHEHPEGGKVEEVGRDATSAGGSAQGDSWFECVKKGGG